MTNIAEPVKTSERYIILDVLRGIALLGICLANYQEFSLYSFLDRDVVRAMPTADADHIWRYFHYIFIDGKFYTLFSLLFGVGFSIIISNVMQKNRNGLRIFYRRMIVLAVIGFAHLLLLWAGDILVLYALLGLLLPLFRNLSDKNLLICSAVLLLLPVAVDACTVLFGWNLAASAVGATQYFHDKAGITDENFAVWLAEKNSYPDVLRFNLAGSFIRLQEFIDGNRYFKVLGLFLLGLYIGRNRMYARLEDNKPLLKKIRFYGFIIGLPLSVLYSWSAINAHPLGLLSHSAIYTASVLPVSLAYISAICLCYLKHRERKIFPALAAPGRMALTAYIGQSALGMMIFYGIGFGLGATVGLVYVELIAAGVFLLQAIFSRVWLHYFRFGPLEWIWRMLSYGKRLKIT
jgi:uncharacterized protein